MNNITEATKITADAVARMVEMTGLSAEITSGDVLYRGGAYVTLLLTVPADATRRVFGGRAHVNVTVYSDGEVAVSGENTLDRWTHSIDEWFERETYAR